MSEMTIRKVENGYVINEVPDPYGDDLCYVARTDKEMVDHVTEFFFGGVLDVVKVSAPEPTQDTPDEGVPAPLPIEPMADLSGNTDPLGSLGDTLARLQSNGSAEQE